MNYRQMIDDYLSGRLSTDDKAVLENRLSADPELKGEFDLQKNIVSSIQHSRRIELKSRLNNIQVHWYHTMPGSWKIAAAVSALTVSTLSAYFYVDQINARLDRININDDAVTELVLNDNIIPEKPSVNLMDQMNTEPENIPETAPAVTEPAEQARTTPDKKQAESGIPDREELSAQVDVPDMPNEFENDGDLDMSDATDNNLKNINPVNAHIASNLEVKTLKDKKYNFHYRLSNGSLSLFGNFEENPYEILEINSNDGKRFYLNYREHYYRLENTSEIRELTPVTDENLINELNIVKENK